MSEGMRQVESVLGRWVTGDGQVQYTPAGLAWAQDWGSLRMTANAAFLAVVYAKQIARALLSHNQTPMHGMASHGRYYAAPIFLRNADQYAVVQHRNCHDSRPSRPASQAIEFLRQTEPHEAPLSAHFVSWLHIAPCIFLARFLQILDVRTLARALHFACVPSYEDHAAFCLTNCGDVRSNKPDCGSAVPVLGAQPGALCLLLNPESGGQR